MIEGREVLKLRESRQKKLKAIGTAAIRMGGTRRERAKVIGISQNKLRLIEQGRYIGPEIIMVCEKTGFPPPVWLLRKLRKDGSL